MKPRKKKVLAKGLKQKASFTSQVVKTAVRSAAGTIVATIVSAALGPVAGALTKSIISGHDDDLTD